MTEMCAVCAGREVTGDEQRLSPNSDSSMPSQLKGGRTALALKCRDCGELWTLLDTAADHAERRLAKGEARL